MHVATFRFVSAALRPGCALLALGLAASCANPGPRLSPEVVSTVDGTVVRTFVRNTLEVAYIAPFCGPDPISALVAAGIDAHRREEAERHAQKLRSCATNVDFRAMYHSEISNAVRSVAWLKVQGIEEGSGPVIRSMVAQHAVLNLESDQELSADCRVLVVRTSLDFFPRGNVLPAAQPMVTTYQSAKEEGVTSARAIGAWLADGAAAYRRAAQEAARESAKAVRYALEFLGGADGPGRRVVLYLHPGWGGEVLSGVLLEEDADRVLFRTDDGQFFSLPRSDVEISECHARTSEDAGRMPAASP